MADRTDPTQYKFAPNGTTFLMPSAVTDTQHQDTADGVYADSADMGHPDHANPHDVTSVRPADFFTQAPTPTREVGQPFPFSVSTPVYFADGYLAGINVRETSGTARALVNLRDGGDVGGNILATFSLAAGESARDWMLPGGIPFNRGLYVDIATGSVAGIAYVARTILV